MPRQRVTARERRRYEVWCRRRGKALLAGWSDAPEKLIAMVSGWPSVTVIRVVDLHDPPSIRCQTCQQKSYNPYDIKHRYCGFCKTFLDEVDTVA